MTRPDSWRSTMDVRRGGIQERGGGGGAEGRQAEMGWGVQGVRYQGILTAALCAQHASDYFEANTSPSLEGREAQKEAERHVMKRATDQTKRMYSLRISRRACGLTGENGWTTHEPVRGATALMLFDCTGKRSIDGAPVTSKAQTMSHKEGRPMLLLDARPG